MKVVLFCGGLGTRLREYSDTIPKPLVPIGHRPIIWHLMKYYASYGHTEFILCLGYRGLLIKEYFMEYKEWASNDFRLSGGGDQVELFSTDLDDWSITFVDTGRDTNIGQRLRAVREHLGDDEIFLANYSDGLSDLPLDDQVASFRRSGAVASFVSVRPSQSFHTIRHDESGWVTAINDAQSSGIWVNGGFFVMRPEIFDYLEGGEELVEEPFRRLTGEKRLLTFPHTGFWACMDTFKDKKMFDDMYEAGERPWEVWGRAGTQDAAGNPVTSASGRGNVRS